MTAWSGPPPPSPDLTDLARAPAPLDTLRGRWVLMNLWATWCGPCKDEMPSLERLRSRLNPRGLEVVAVNLGESVNQIEAFLEKNPVKLTIRLDPGKQTMSGWRVRVLPTSFLIDRQGVVRFSHVGAREWDEPRLVAALESLLAR